MYKTLGFRVLGLVGLDCRSAGVLSMRRAHGRSTRSQDAIAEFITLQGANTSTKLGLPVTLRHGAMKND